MAVVIPQHVKVYILSGLCLVSAFIGMMSVDYDLPGWQRLAGTVPFLLVMFAAVWIMLQPHADEWVFVKEENRWQRR